MGGKSTNPGLMRRWKQDWVHLGPSSRRWRRNAWIDMVFFDDGMFRALWPNLEQIHEGVWRSSQPGPALIGRMTRKEGIKAVLNLRGETLYGSYLLEKEACAALGLDLVNLKTQSRYLPDVAKIEEIDAVFATIPHPFLMHCKSGADRAGLVSALYLLLRTDRPVSAAQAQLSARYLHFRQSRTGVLDFMIDAYAAVAAQRSITFREWIHSEYDPDALLARFRSGKAADFLVDRVLGRE